MSAALVMKASLLNFLLIAALGTGGENPPDPTMGFWEGKWTTGKREGGMLETKIVALGNDEYEGKFTAHCGWIGHFTVPMKGKREGDTVRFAGKVDLGAINGGVFEWTGQSTGGKFTGSYTNGQKYNGTLAMERIEKKAPNLGTKPPAGAIVLFDGTSLDAWTRLGGGTPTWDIVDGAMRVARKPGPDGKMIGGNLVSKHQFADAKVHVEFRTPYMPASRGQRRGNSGVYLQTRYEVQVLDSFGEPARNNEAGGIYEIAAPKVNAAFPPGQWQAYDITFRAPRFVISADGKSTLAKPAELSVVHNGVAIHDRVLVDRPTRAAADNKMDQLGGLMLQDHGDPVEFRNIWLVPISD